MKILPPFSVNKSLPSGRKAIAHGVSNSATDVAVNGAFASAFLPPALMLSAETSSTGRATIDAARTNGRLKRARRISPPQIWSTENKPGFLTGFLHGG